MGRGLISRATATEALKRTAYERLDVSPNAEAYARGERMTVYFTPAVRKWYSYGDGATVEGYIAPWHDTEYPEAVARAIGYRGSVELFRP